MTAATPILAIEPTIESDFTFPPGEDLPLDGGGSLARPTIRYAVYGDPARLRTDAVLVCHALSGNARVADWWPGLFGAHRPLDLSKVAVVCSNIIGSCYGSTGPTSADPETGVPYAERFPVVSIRDIVRAQRRLADHLGISRFRAVIGASIGGMQALQWAIDDPERVESAVAIGAAPLSALGLALNHIQRHAIRIAETTSDPAAGLALARAVATCTYKSAELFDKRYGRSPDRSGEDPVSTIDARYDVAGYLDHQGAVFVDRFDADAYRTITKAMDTFDVNLDESVLSRIRSRLLLVGISSDWLFPPATVQTMANRLARAGIDAQYAELETDHGHDGFLVEESQLAHLASSFLWR